MHHHARLHIPADSYKKWMSECTIVIPLQRSICRSGGPSEATWPPYVTPSFPDALHTLQFARRHGNPSHVCTIRCGASISRCTPDYSLNITTSRLCG